MIVDMKRDLILLLACLVTQIALSEPSLAEKNAAENAAIKKEWESWNAPFKPFRLIGNIHYVGASGFSPVRGGIFVEPDSKDFQAPLGAPSSGKCRS